jgi:hypothetical protein
MKLQYLGDSKDSFKWDYHDYLTEALGCPVLNILLMMTPDDNSNHGKTDPENFPAREKVIEYCNLLRSDRNTGLIRQLPVFTGAQYRLDLHKPDIIITRFNRRNYFSGLSVNEDQVVLLDPDNGFQPERSSNSKHVLYSEISQLLDQISEKSVISVFQHFRRISFKQDFRRISQRLNQYYSTAIYWHQLMFVAVSKSKQTIAEVVGINEKYAKRYPVKLVTGTQCL